jgi:hypothetical protein
VKAGPETGTVVASVDGLIATGEMYRPSRAAGDSEFVPDMRLTRGMR